MIGYERLVELFWRSHGACSAPWSRQYMSALWYHDVEQKRIALAVKAREEARLGKPVVTEIAPFERFWLAEDYHQKYELRSRRGFASEMLAYYPELRDFVDSTAVARLNGILGGYGEPAAIEPDLPQLGLSPARERELRDALGARE